MEDEKKTAEETGATPEVGSDADTHQNTETVNDAEFTDSNEGGQAQPKPQEQPKPQTREQNSENARRRREAETKAAIEEAAAKAREQAIIETLGGKNPYTNEEMKDHADVEEWWFWDNVPVRVWANIDNQLFFGSANGQVCVFDDEYTDRTYQTSEPGDLALDIAENKITFNQNIDIGLAENDSITLTTPGLYALLQDDCEVEDGYIYTSEDDILHLYDGMEVYADNVGESGLEVDRVYTLYSVDKGQCTYQLLDDEGNLVPLACGGFRLHRAISNKELYLTNVTEDSFQLKDYKTSEPMTFSDYNASVPTTPLASFVHRANVVAEWYTPIFDFGTNESSKTLLKMTISTEPEVNGKLSFGYETKSVNKLLNAKGINVFSFENFSFENFSFDTGFASSYSVKSNERNFNFIIFRFVSDNEFNCAVNNFTAIYKINKSNKGVR